MKRTRKTTLVVAGLATAAAIAATTVAAVTGAPGAANAAPTPDGRHCAFNPQNGERTCFDRLDEAVAFASGGAIEDGPADGTEARGDTRFKAQLKAAEEENPNKIIQGTLFENENFGGASLTVYGPEMCEKDGWVNYQLDDLGDWKNRISSVGAWGDCWIWLYPEPNLGGSRDGPFKGDVGNIGELMNDRAQSVAFS